MNGEKSYRVYNVCKYDIGVRTVQGFEYVIKPNSFAVLSATDILFIESVCRRRKFFSERMLIIKDDHNAEVPLSEIGIADVDQENMHYSDAEIEAALKQNVKKVEAWIADINDDAELFAIYEVAKKMDLPASKLRILSDKIPDKSFIE